jgi:hypothetical protein
MDARKRRRYEVIADPAYVENLEGRSLEDLRSLRDECREVENELSFERRLCHARIDILRAEIERRTGEQDQDLLSRLPEIRPCPIAHATCPCLATPIFRGAGWKRSPASRRWPG